MMMPQVRGRLKVVIAWGVFLGAGFLIDQFLGSSLEWAANLTPLSIFKLEPGTLKAFGLTAMSSLLAWGAAIGGGGALGVLAASATLSEPKNRVARFLLRRLSKLNILYDGLYVVPVVLTLSLMFAVLMRFFMAGVFPRVVVAVGLIVFAGMVLGGYHVFQAIYNAAAEPKWTSRVLVRSLMYPDIRRGYLGRLQGAIEEVRRLVGCEIKMLCQALEHALHLSIVAVVILETITPQVYEFVFPQTGASVGWLGGVGQEVISAQQTYSFDVIAGAIWLVILFDWLLLQLIQSGARATWLGYYRS